MVDQPYYQDSAVTIYHGDCRQILPFLGRFDLLLTDPPYGIGFASQPTKYQRYAGKKPEAWDDEPVEEWIIASIRTMTEKQIIWGGHYYNLPGTRCILSWCKPNAPPSMGSVEYAWTNLSQNSRYILHSISATNAERRGHPTQKPLAVISWAMQQATGYESVLDPFAGSGTTGRVAKDLGKKATLIEREERYCEIAAKRMGQEVFSFSEF
jgi:site-specific DNA-methyltransferase (adenine-specific)